MGQEDAALTGDEGAELERLRVEVASLRSQVQAGRAVPEERVAPSGRLARRRWRTIVASLLIALACVLAPLSVVAVWARNQVTNTDRYIQTVSPLARDPAIQNAIADQITAQVFTYLVVGFAISLALSAI